MPNKSDALNARNPRTDDPDAKRMKDQAIGYFNKLEERVIDPASRALADFPMYWARINQSDIKVSTLSNCLSHTVYACEKAHDKAALVTALDFLNQDRNFYTPLETMLTIGIPTDSRHLTNCINYIRWAIGKGMEVDTTVNKFVAAWAQSMTDAFIHKPNKISHMEVSFGLNCLASAAQNGVQLTNDSMDAIDRSLGRFIDRDESGNRHFEPNGKALILILKAISKLKDMPTVLDDQLTPIFLKVFVEDHIPDIEDFVARGLIESPEDLLLCRQMVRELAPEAFADFIGNSKTQTSALLAACDKATQPLRPLGYRDTVTMALQFLQGRMKPDIR